MLSTPLINLNRYLFQIVFQVYILFDDVNWGKKENQIKTKAMKP